MPPKPRGHDAPFSSFVDDEDGSEEEKAGGAGDNADDDDEGSRKKKYRRLIDCSWLVSKAAYSHISMSKLAGIVGILVSAILCAVLPERWAFVAIAPYLYVSHTCTCTYMHKSV
jgi:hypothetical protein